VQNGASERRLAAECGDECMSFAASAEVAPGPTDRPCVGRSTVGSLIDEWPVLVPLTQLLSAEQLVGRIAGKLDTIRTWRLPP